jgi:hypothetical protein
MKSMAIVSASYRRPIGTALVTQAIVAVLSGMILDGGTVMRICLVAMIAFWAGAAVLIWRRPQSPTKTDLALIRLGYLLVVAIAAWVVPAIWAMRGY